jgi:hypothetical protein
MMSVDSLARAQQHGTPMMLLRAAHPIVLHVQRYLLHD